MPSVSPELTLSLSASTVRALLEAFGPPRGLRANAPLVSVARALFAGRATLRLARAFAEVARFAPEAGRRAIAEAARACGDARADAWLGQAAPDVAAALVLERATATDKAAKRAAKRILALATLRLERRLPDRPTYELLTERAAPPDAEALRAALARGLGDDADDVWVRAAEDGAVDVAVFLRGSAAHALLPGARRGTPVRRLDRTLTVDALRVTPDGTRVTITPTAPETLARYVSILGLSLRPSFTLRPFHHLTPSTFARSTLPHGVRSAVVVGERRREPNGARYETRAFDLAALSPSPRAGYVNRITLRTEAEGAARPLDAFLELPHRIEIVDRAHEAPVRALLGATGVFAPGALPDDAWSLAPFVHGDWRWRGVLGHAAVNRLLRTGLLARVRAPHVATEEHRMLGTTYVVREVPGEPSLEYALSEDPSYPARLVRPEDRVALRLDLARLAATMQRSLGAAGATGAPVDGVLDLGELPIGAGKLRFFYAASAPAAGWAGVVRRACGVVATPVLLVPRGRDVQSEVTSVELDVAEQLGAASLAHVVARAAEQLGVAKDLAPWRNAREDLVIDRATERVWIHGVLVTKLTDTPYRFLARLAQSPGRVMAAKELGGHVSRSEYPDVAARRAKAELERQVRACLEEAGEDAAVAAKIVIAEGRRGYRLGVSVKVV